MEKFTDVEKSVVAWSSLPELFRLLEMACEAGKKLTQGKMQI